MSDRWTIIDENAVKAGKVSAYLTTVRALATGRSEADPLPEMIGDVVATIRAACSSGNQLDLDTTKIPNSLKGLAVRMVLRRLKDYIDDKLTPDEVEQAKEDAGYLRRIMDSKTRFETPDQAAASGEMQSAGGLDTITSSPRVATRESMNGL